MPKKTKKITKEMLITNKRVTKEMKKEAKRRTLIAWKYLRDHPEIDSKLNLPIEIFKEIETPSWFDLADCPLCWLFRNTLKKDFFYTYSCKSCPLQTCKGEQSWYNKWNRLNGEINRKEAATAIYNTVKAWKI